MRTALFATCYAGHPGTINRYRQYLDYYLPKLDKLGAGRIFLIDDGSPIDHLNQLGIPIVEVDNLNQRDFPELTEPAYIFHFGDNLGRPVTTIMPGWWRSFSFISILAYIYGLDKLIHIESDVYLFSDRIFDWIRDTNSRWTVPFSRQHRYPMSELQIIPQTSKINWYYPERPKNNFKEIFQYFVKGKEFWYKDCLGNAQYIPELCLPFDEVVHTFKVDRYGEDWCKKLPEEMDGISNITDISLNQRNHQNIQSKMTEILTEINKNINEKEFGEEITAFHSGDMGDVIYSLPVMKQLNVTTIMLNPAAWYGTKMNEKLIAILKPLLEQQGFKVTMPPIKPYSIDYDFDTFRYTNQDLYFTHLGSSQGYALGLDPDLTQPWLYAEPNSIKPIVIARSERYQTPYFKWRELLTGHEDKCIFVGLPDEYESFVKTTGLKITYHPTKDLLELAQVIAGADIFIGNQSTPYAIAEGLKVTRIQEVCDWVPNCRPSGVGDWVGVDSLDKMFDALTLLRKALNNE